MSSASIPKLFAKLMLTIVLSILTLVAFTPYVSAQSTSSYSKAGDCSASLSKTDCKIIDYLVDFINLLSALVGLVVVAMIIWGGIQYTSARDNPQQAASAKEHIRNAIFALVFYIFSIALLNWLVPGGVLL